MVRVLMMGVLLALPASALAQAQNPAPQGKEGKIEGQGLGGVVAFPPFKVDQVKVDKAIEAGIKNLKGQNAAHLNRFTHAGRQMQHCELVLWTYVHAGVPENDPAFVTLFDDMMKRQLEATYCVSLQAMILEEIGRVKHQHRIAMCGQFLADNQSAAGYWGYGDPSIFVEDVPTGAPTRADVSTSGSLKGATAKKFDTLPPPGMRAKPAVKSKIKITKKREGNPNDNSNTQYATLGMRACHDAGIEFEAKVIDALIGWYRQTQKAPEGPEMKLDLRDAAGRPIPGQSGVMESVSAAPAGWCYGQHEHKPYGSMSAGSMGGLAIMLYIKDNDGGKKKSWRRDKDVNEGLAWLAKNFSVTYNPGPYEHANFAENSQVQYYYFLYALERAGMLYGTETMGTHEWYPEGAKVLIEAQKGDGSWGAGTVDTCFAILFLKRATRPLDVATHSAGSGK